MDPEPHALILDDEHTCLGALGLQLVRFGIPVLHATGRDEAWLLAEQEKERVRALLFPPSIPLDDARSVAELWSEGEEEGPPSLVVVGAPPPEPTCAALRSGGVDWALWEPYDESALRFVVNAALALPRDVAPAREPRAPTPLLADLKSEGERRDAVVYLLSPRGAFLESTRPFPEGARLHLEIPLPDAPLGLEAQVIYTNDSSARRTRSLPVGMGVVFAEPPEEVAARLRAYVEAHARFGV